MQLLAILVFVSIVCRGLQQYNGQTRNALMKRFHDLEKLQMLTQVFDERNASFPSSNLFVLHRLYDLWKQQGPNKLTVSSECSADVQLIARSIEAILLNIKNGRTNGAVIDYSILLRQMDSFGKPGPGILRGNLQWRGSYLECVSIDETIPRRIHKYRGGYCTAVYSMVALSSAEAAEKKGNGHCSQSFSLLNYGICLPKTCANSRDAPNILTFVNRGDSSSFCHVNCVNAHENKLGWRGSLVSAILIIVALFALFSTILDYCWYQDNKEVARTKPLQCLLAFSLYTNIKEIMNTEKASGQIGCIHFIRFVSMIWVIAGHAFAIVMYLADNPVDFVPVIRAFFSQLVTNAFFSVDSFFFLSGLMIGFIWFKDLTKKRLLSPQSWLHFYAHRFIRLSPPYFVILAGFTWILPFILRMSPTFIGSIDTYIAPCQRNWWTNFLYVQNLVNYDDQCYLPAWYLATDMQMHVLSPLILIPLALRPSAGTVSAVCLILLSMATNMWTIFHYHMPPSDALTPLTPIDPRFPRDHFSEYTFFIYDAPWIRFPVYVIGLLLGYFLQTNERPVKINKIVNLGLWLLSVSLMLTVLFGLHDWLAGAQMPLFWRSVYSAFSKPVWALALAWMVFSCYYGHAGPIDRLMSWNVWIPLGRLTYCAYLVHFLVSVLFLNTSYTPLSYSSVTDVVLHFVVPVSVLSYAFALIWSATFEVSTSKIEKILFGTARGRQYQETSKDKLKLNCDGTEVLAVATSNHFPNINDIESGVKF